jgi:hypothetical protein
MSVLARSRSDYTAARPDAEGRRAGRRELARGCLRRVISPTDCVKDRLAWYYHYGDRQCLAQAILVSRDHRVDLNEIRRWSEAEGKRDEFEEIRQALAG